MDFSREATELLHQLVTILYGIDAEDALHKAPERDQAIGELKQWMLSNWNDGYNIGYQEGRCEY